MPYSYSDCDPADSHLSNFPAQRKAGTMDQDQQTEASTTSDLVVENLVEEVSIDGMCGVY